MQHSQPGSAYTKAALPHSHRSFCFANPPRPSSLPNWRDSSAKASDSSLLTLQGSHQGQSPLCICAILVVRRATPGATISSGGGGLELRLYRAGSGPGVNLGVSVSWTQTSMLSCRASLAKTRVLGGLQSRSSGENGEEQPWCTQSLADYVAHTQIRHLSVFESLCYSNAYYFTRNFHRRRCDRAQATVR